MGSGGAGPVADLSDRDLLALHVAGDDQAFGELFRRHKDRMWAVALRTVRDPELAADCVQDGFIAAFRRADSFRGEAAVTTWLHRIVVNACLDRLRRRRPTAELPEYELADRHDHHASTEVRLDIQEALAALPAGQRAGWCSSTCTRFPSPRRRSSSAWPRGRSSPGARAAGRPWPSTWA